MTATIQVSSHWFLTLIDPKCVLRVFFHQLNETFNETKRFSITLIKCKRAPRYFCNGIETKCATKMHNEQYFSKEREREKLPSGVYLSSARGILLNISKRQCSLYNKEMETLNIYYNKELPYLFWHQNRVPQGTKERATLISKTIRYEKKASNQTEANSSLQLCDKEMSFSVLALHNLCLTVHKRTCLLPITLRAKTQC